MSYNIRSASIHDAKDIANIYNYYVSHSIATFEEELVSTEQIQHRIKQVNVNNLPWLVAVQICQISGKEKVVGYAYASKWKDRPAYRFSVEVSVYLSPNCQAQGLGSNLYAALFSSLKVCNVHTLIAGISLPNQASIALHEKFGFVQTALFEQVGFKFEQWIDVGYWKAPINRIHEYLESLNKIP